MLGRHLHDSRPDRKPRQWPRELFRKAARELEQDHRQRRDHEERRGHADPGPGHSEHPLVSSNSSRPYRLTASVVQAEAITKISGAITVTTRRPRTPPGRGVRRDQGRDERQERGRKACVKNRGKVAEDRRCAPNAVWSGTVLIWSSAEELGQLVEPDIEQLQFVSGHDAELAKREVAAPQVIRYRLLL